MGKRIEIGGTLYVVDMSPEFGDAFGAGDVAGLLEQIDLTVERGDLLKLADGTWVAGASSMGAASIIFHGGWDRLSAWAPEDGWICEDIIFLSERWHWAKRFEIRQTMAEQMCGV